MINFAAQAPLLVLDRAATARALDMHQLVQALGVACDEYAAGKICSPARLHVPLEGDGVCLSMPASARDIAIHKLVCVQPGNAKLALPTIHGIVTVCDAITGKPICIADGPEMTGRRTAGISMLAVKTFLDRPPVHALLIGTGRQAAHHAYALSTLFPHCHILARGRSPESERAFCETHRHQAPNLRPCPATMPTNLDVVITLTTSTEVVYDAPATIGRLVVGVGAFRPDMAEIGARTLMDSDLFVDDPVGARHEAGDFIRAGVDWSSVRPLVQAIHAARPRKPVVFKSVGNAAWDLAAARVLLTALELSQQRDKG